ncbi:radical SAM/SPASM domain-containing protein [Tepidibacter aestuarii]|uniref:radical SAM/SPASM domain-containing protein n=1 Tax=Tepidibacter aestuarii TaxID=2925782 RepID=UPI0020BFB75E|nr:radical SAM protein [Tepidibacter aestuarii]CAH2212024.1 Fe-coproporphyrin III synthase [Tepidibacter aestuarii]
MIDLSKLLSKDDIQRGSIRYSKDCSKAKAGVRKGMGPVVVWNITNVCNFKCKHCYSSATATKDQEELTFEQIKKVVDDLATINVPVILLSGGEPLMRENIFEIIEYIKSKGINVSLSTNGSLITKDVARKLKNLGIGYVGISLDGTSKTNDIFRGVSGSYDSIIKAIKNCKEVDQKVGLRFTIQKKNYKEVTDILKLVDEIDIPRICFYHLVPSGRGQNIINDMLTHDQTREVLDNLYDYVKKNIVNGIDKEILTVANFADGIYIYLKEKDEYQKSRILDLLSRNGGNRSGIAISNIDYKGNVYIDQFSKNHLLGNIKQDSFSSIWNENKEGLLNEIRNKKDKVKGRCKECKWLNICNGNLRARAYGYYNDIWAEDPSCYLTDDEIRSEVDDYIVEYD